MGVRSVPLPGLSRAGDATTDQSLGGLETAVDAPANSGEINFLYIGSVDCFGETNLNRNEVGRLARQLTCLVLCSKRATYFGATWCDEESISIAC
jgi:hypothetical protein